jgi:isoleucyl-tRNA synthetase
MEEIDRWALYRLQAVIERTRKAYENFQFHIVYYTLYNYCTVDLSSLYLDVLKDRLYTSGNASKQRRSAQSAMFIILDAMTRMLAPILTFTAEEVWQSLPAYGGKAASVHLTQFPEASAAWADEKLGDTWKTLISVRGEISKAMETARKNKVIGHPLDAAVTVTGSEKLVELLSKYEEDMRAFCIISGFRAQKGGELKDAFESTELPGLKIAVTKAGGEKCMRCWVFSEELGRDANHPKICPKCLANLG